ncbi:hypothetical protein J2Z79_003377 [Symbiobacterium terraclitae]|uniref:DUF1540 domain-containing protein n=1 Tax=Symbiobacterium terraclitae TaxID=557451 RepID=A0ABS4JWM3_9FIRM|nr:DUF1540 domain-containing protein [Symbiobacterium terraclitae]MBP2019930.1 hypothetical protein [Symbiobacterium terraclitae]
MASQQIRCTVSSCYYYESNDRCAAEQIMVRSKPGAGGSANMEVGAIGGQAQESNQTLCETFIPHTKGPKPGIRRIGS